MGKKQTTTATAAPVKVVETTRQQQQVNQEDVVVPLHKRPYDLFIIGFYLVFILSSATIDYHNVLGPAMGLSIPELQHAKKPLNWPPQFITDQVYMPWGNNIDPIMIENPFFWQVMEWINILFLTPVNAILAFAFLFGKAGSYRSLAFIHSSALLYSMVLCLATGLEGATNPIQFVICYSLYATYPIAIMTRLWNERPFSKRVVNNKGFLQKALQGFLALHLFFFIMFCYHWLVIHTPFAQGLPDWYPLFDEYVLSKIPILAQEPYATWLKQLNAKW